MRLDFGIGGLPSSARIAGAAMIALLALPGTAPAQVTAFKQAVAEGIAGNAALSTFYRETNFEPIWTGRDDRARRSALLSALASAEDHALPRDRYDPDRVRALLRDADTARERGAAEVELSRIYLEFARDLQTGVIENPARIDSGIVRRIPRRDRVALLRTVAEHSPRAVFRGLVPRSPEYTRLMAEKERLERLLGQGGWGEQVPGRKLEPGDTGRNVIALRNRLIRMGYMRRTASASYDANLQKAVQRFQADHGLITDGVAGPSTLSQINTSAAARLRSVIVAMERERWLNRDRGARHILVNLTDFTAKIVDDGRVTFETRSVVGANAYDRRSPEFSDEMEHMVINPTWNVPRSIAVKEYLPQMQDDPSAAGHLRLVDSRGRVVSREGIDFTQFSASDFPFDLKQPPSRSNALGLVKFMFPNRYNIYLHDTPADHLFAREVRAFSHGCIRLNDPFEFAYRLLARQVADPQGFFHERLNTGRETVVELDEHVPVHLVYRTAFTRARGRVNYRRDVYGRDAKIWSALRDAGVVLRAVRS